MAESGLNFSGITPLPPRVVSVHHALFDAPDELGLSISVPTSYQLFTSAAAPTNDLGSNGDWYLLALAATLSVYRKVSDVWTLVTSFSGGGAQGPIGLTGAAGAAGAAGTNGAAGAAGADGATGPTGPAGGGMTNPMTTAGDTIVGGVAGAPGRLALGTALQVRRVNAAGTAEEFSAPASGTSNASRIKMSADQSIPATTETAVSWGTEVFDDDTFWVAGTPTRITIPSDGRYFIHAALAYATNGTGERHVIIKKNGSAYASTRTLAVPANATIIEANTMGSFVAGDYFEVFSIQTSGGALNVVNAESTNFFIFKV